MNETSQEDALRLALGLVGDALKDTESRCSVLALYIESCDRAGAATASGAAAVRELRELQDVRRALVRRHSLIQQALDVSPGKSPGKTQLEPPPRASATRPQQQLQVRSRRRQA